MLGIGGTNPLTRLIDISDTHNIYEVYYDRREAVKGREIYGDKQVHVTGLNVTKFPSYVKKMASPFGKEKGTVSTWYYKPNESIEIILTIFKQAGYKLLKTMERQDRIGNRNTVYIVVKKK